MNSKVLSSVAIATFIGILIGLFSAWSFDDLVGPYWPLAWIAGIAIGGAIGYLTCDLQAAVRAIPPAWENAQRHYRTVSALRLRPERILEIVLTMRAIPQTTLAIMCIVIWPMTLFAVADMADRTIHHGVPFDLMFGLKVGCVVTLMISLPGGLIIPLFCIARAGNRDDDSNVDSEYRKLMKWTHFCIKYLNPFSLFCVWLPYGLFYAVYHYGRSSTVMLFQFAWQLYVLIHTEARLICLMVVMVFVGGFYFTHSVPWAFVAATLGAISGIVHYVIIAPRIVPPTEVTA